ncbi:polymorphic toxin type 43 domain-containing protein [Hydrogenophaga sp. 5NK40-0174]|uniref:polymorphic toxin type 43 domain-containing protein n=1 Tax=Hydrogenophaga sp. 5NK40-0174 TaxID=3127649 RepID=UPI003340EE13
MAQFKEATEQMNQLSRLMGAAGALLVGGDADSMNLAAATALNAAQNNRQLHVTEEALINANAARYAAERGGISEDQARKELTEQALKQVDSDWSKKPHNAEAAAFLDMLRSENANGENFTAATGQNLFDETNNALLYNNHALNSQFLNDATMRELYNLAQRPGAGPNQFDAAAFATVRAAGDYANFKNLRPQDRIEVLSAMVKAHEELKDIGSPSANLMEGAIIKTATLLRYLDDITFDELARAIPDAYISLAMAQTGAGLMATSGGRRALPRVEKQPEVKPPSKPLEAADGTAGSPYSSESMTYGKPNWKDTEFNITKEPAGPASESSSSAPQFSGSGPAPGVIAITDTSSVAVLQSYKPSGREGIEFVFDPVTNTFAVGKPRPGLYEGSPHQQLAQSIGANESTVVGGTFIRKPDGSIVTTENSGHYGQNWTPEIMTNFESWLSRRLGVKVNHQQWSGQ